MTLTDTGPLIALVDRNDIHHSACTKLLVTLSPPLVTSWPCFAEAMHLLGRIGGYPAQNALWEYVAIGALIICTSDAKEQARMRTLMTVYRDTPMDLADAALVAAAETLGTGLIFSVDSDFYIYRLADGRALEVVPGPRANSDSKRS
jgi:predicted nucleic acid-binding protein